MSVPLPKDQPWRMPDWAKRTFGGALTGFGQGMQQGNSQVMPFPDQQPGLIFGRPQVAPPLMPAGGLPFGQDPEKMKALASKLNLTAPDLY